jgi:hypothetical protein
VRNRIKKGTERMTGRQLYDWRRSLIRYTSRLSIGTSLKWGRMGGELGREKIREKGMERNGCCLSIRVEKNVIGNRLFLSVLGSGAARLRAALFSELI